MLGAVRAWRGRTEVDVGARKPRAVLAALLLRADRPVNVDEIARFVWGQTAPAGVSAAVHTYVAGLRTALDPGRKARCKHGLVSSSHQGYRLRVNSDVVDALAFRRLLLRARTQWQAGQVSAAAQPLAAALRLWKGQPLAGIDHHKPMVVAALEQERLSAGLLAADVALAGGEVDAWLPALTEIAASAPLHEAMQAKLMEALWSAGRRADALVVFERTRHALDDELGIGPGPQLRTALHSLLDEDRLVAAGR